MCLYVGGWGWSGGGGWHCLLKPPERIVSLCSVLVLFMGCIVLHAYSAGSNRQRTSLFGLSPINRARVADRGSRTVSFVAAFISLARLSGCRGSWMASGS